MVKVKATEVKPFHYGIWCSIEDGKPFVNTIVITRWADDGKYIRYMLDTHNFDRAEPDEILELVPIDPDDWYKKEYANWTIGPRPLHAHIDEPFRRKVDLTDDPT